jgi:hypothetical protein
VFAMIKQRTCKFNSSLQDNLKVNCKAFATSLPKYGNGNAITSCNASAMASQGNNQVFAKHKPCA